MPRKLNDKARTELEQDFIDACVSRLFSWSAKESYKIKLREKVKSMSDRELEEALGDANQAYIDSHKSDSYCYGREY